MGKYRSKEGGLTLIELMIVVLVLGVLSGISISVVNRGQQQGRAKDAVNLSSLTKAASAIESYYYGEGNYPVITAADNGNPLLNSTNISLDVYLKTWPDGFFYLYDSASGTFAVYVKRNVDGNFYKYISTDTVIKLCNKSNSQTTTVVSACTVIP
ncbi:prepilin-type N-terminal cleavage/methylation domain-containing protein [Patescibacteria group bacterium]|nr:prepilin-type N-terminal cleavage/methylation domain-containing protein [Patescibacteria group bacterium]MBU1952789.1 prepilin-type N-terminal cleavage/methylation domain-containing protein [Patescibacteria group bacterium]